MGAGRSVLAQLGRQEPGARARYFFYRLALQQRR